MLALQYLRRVLWVFLAISASENSYAQGDEAPLLELVGQASTENAGKFETTGETFRRQFFLQWKTASTLTDLPNEIVLANAPEGIDVEAVNPSAEVKRGDDRVPQTIVVSANLPEVGAYELVLTLALKDKKQSYAIIVTRKQPDLLISRSSKGMIGLTARSEDFKSGLQVSLGSGAPIDGVTLTADALTGPDGQSIDILFNGDNRQLDIGRITTTDPRSFDIGAKLAEVGEYRGGLHINYPGGRKSVILTIKKELLALGVEGKTGGTVFQTLPAIEETAVSIPIDLLETAGRTTLLGIPRLAVIGRQKGEVSSAVAAPGKITIRVQGQSDPLTEPIKLDAKSTKTIVVDIAGLTQPGVHTARLNLSGQDRAPGSVDISFTLKRSAWIAAALIFIGAIVSMFLRWWINVHRPRLEDARTLLAAARTLKQFELSIAPVMSAERGVLDHIRHGLEVAFNAVQAGGDVDVASIKVKLDKKFPVLRDWVQLHRAMGSATDTAIVANFAAVRAYLVSHDPSEPEHKAAVNAIGALEQSASSLRLPEIPDNQQGIDDAIAAIAQQTMFGNFLFHAGVISIAVLLGVYVLWSEDPDWGGPHDMLLAAIWGLGLHSLSAGTGNFTGIQDLANSFKVTK